MGKVNLETSLETFLLNSGHSKDILTNLPSLHDLGRAISRVNSPPEKNKHQPPCNHTLSITTMIPDDKGQYILRSVCSFKFNFLLATVAHTYRLTCNISICIQCEHV